MGSKKTRNLVNEIYETNEKFNIAIEDKDTIKQKHLTMIKEENNRYALAKEMHLDYKNKDSC